MGRRRLAPKFIQVSRPRQLTRQQCEQYKLRGRLPVHAPSPFASKWAKSETHISREVRTQPGRIRDPAPSLFKNAPQIPSAPPVVSANRAKLLGRAAPRIVPR